MSPEDGPAATALRTSQAEWVQGTGDRPSADDWAHPLTAHRYEGLLVLLDGENWKVLDSVGMRVLKDGRPLALGAPTVEATPLRVTRRYSHDHGPWALTTMLWPHAGSSGTVLDLTVQGPPDGTCRLELMPLFDLRHMYADSDPERIQAAPAPEGVAVTGGRAALLMTMPGAIWHPERREHPLDHPMGSGFRERVGDRIQFRPEASTGLSLGTWRRDLAPGEEVTLRLAVAPSLAGARELLEAIRTSPEAALRAERWERIRQRAGATEGLAERIFIMRDGYGMPVADTILPEAGGWWFRTPWFRDVFEGLLGNWRTLVALGCPERVSDALKAAFRLQDPETGRIPNRLPERQADQAIADRTGRLPDEYYHSADATLLAFTLLGELDPYPADARLQADADRAFGRALAAFRRARPDIVDGAPVLTESGLLMCVPWHTWTDGKRTVGPVADLPLRVSKRWQEEALAAGEDVFRINHEAAYYLPEINAQWLRALHWAARHREEERDRAEAAALFDRAAPAFRARFWDPGSARIANLVTRVGRYDWTAGSPGIVAIALLLPLGIFSRAEREAAWVAVRDRLAVRHRGHLFGLLVKDSAERQYLGDEQYHEAVCWPRDSHWLHRLLADLGEEAGCQELLQGALEHQQREGVLFYNHELFSLPDGSKETFQQSTGHRLVPVKNPMQWWSQWCDPFLQRVDNLTSAPER